VVLWNQASISKSAMLDIALNDLYVTDDESTTVSDDGEATDATL